MELLKWYSLILITIIEGFMIYEVYKRIDKKEEFKYQLIGFILMLPVWYLTLISVFEV